MYKLEINLNEDIQFILFIHYHIFKKISYSRIKEDISTLILSISMTKRYCIQKCLTQISDKMCSQFALKLNAF